MPREPQISHDAEPTAIAPATRDGRESGQDGEERIQEEGRLAREQIIARGTRGGEDEPDTGGASSSGHQAEAAAGEGDVAAPGGEAPRSGRGLDLVPRERRTYHEAGGVPNHRTLGKLRHWSSCPPASDEPPRLDPIFTSKAASHHTMGQMLERCGMPEETLQLLPEICQTSKICRGLARPGPSSAINVEIAGTFNAQVGCELLFSHAHYLPHDRPIYKMAHSNGRPRQD